MTIAVQPPGALSDARGYRLTNIDMRRGLVIVIVALDHVRDYVMVGAVQDPTADPAVGAGVFFTRWITHFCAPVFVCLAGTSTARKKGTTIGSPILVARNAFPKRLFE